VVMFFAAKIPPAVLIVPGLFVLIGLAMAALGPVMKLRQARLGWYAVTDRRAIVFHVSIIGKAGKATTYVPAELRAMRVAKSWFVKGGGDLIFRTEVREQRTRYVDRRTGRTTRTETQRTVIHYGFLGIEDVKEVESLIHEVLLSRDRDRDDEEDD